MDLSTAIATVEKYQGIIGKIPNKKKITHLYIIPNNSDYGDIVKRVLRGQDYMDLLVNHKNFSVVVLYDGHNSLNGILFFEDLFIALKKLETNKNG